MILCCILSFIIMAVSIQNIPTCIINIAQRYFIPGCPVLVSTTSHNSDYERFLQTLYVKFVWPVYVYSKNLTLANFEYRTENRNYIVLTSKNVEVIEHLIQTLEEIKNSVGWTRKIRILVVTEEGTKKLAQNIVNRIWMHFRIVNVMILVGYKIFIWKPFQSYSLCANVDLFSTVSCQMLNTHSTALDADISPDQMIRNFHGRTFTFIPVEGRATVIRNETKDGYTFTGLEAGIFNLIIDVLNMSVTYKPLRNNNSHYARVHALEELSNNEFDGTFGGQVMTSTSISSYDSTIPYMLEPIKWYVPCGKPLSRTQKVGTIFSRCLWLSIIVVGISIIHVFRSLAITESQESASYKTLTSCFYLVWAVTLGVSVPEMPRLWKQRLVFITFVWYNFVLGMVFQTFFTSILVDPGVSQQVRNFQELQETNFTLYIDYRLEKVFNQLVLPNYGRIKLRQKYCSHDYICIVEYLTIPDVTFLSFESYTRVTMLELLPPGHNVPKFCVMDETPYMFYFSIHLKRGHHLASVFDRIIRLLTENGLLNKAYKEFDNYVRYEKVKNVPALHIIENKESESFIFGISHLQLAFQFLSAGYFLSGISFICEVLYTMYHQKLGHPNNVYLEKHYC
ncbi:Ionotropic receptor 254 [Blattella germanica]|nr:Ionotropic receptor 254 [Blattella germanica]